MSTSRCLHLLKFELMYCRISKKASLTPVCSLPYFLSAEELGSPYLSLREAILAPLRHANGTIYKMYLRGRERTLATIITCFSQIMRECRV